MYLAFMKETLIRVQRSRGSVSPARTQRSARDRKRWRIRYSLPMRKTPADFASVLSACIDRWYDSDTHFADVAGVSGASVSRWRRGVGHPTARMLQKMAPFIFNEQGKPVPLAQLLALAFPDAKSASPVRPVTARADHPLAIELAKMLDPDSALPAENRDTLTKLVDSIMAPYRTLMRRRKTG